MKSNFLVKVDTSGTTPTATVEERSIGQAVGDSLTTLVKDDEASVGYVKTFVGLGLAYGAAVFAKYRQTNQLSFKPF